MKLTVIVPIYNAEKYLHRCLDSLLDQGLAAGEYEILCVNDGSTDRSSAILQDYAKRFPLIVRILTQENQGVVRARNHGLEEARGEAVTCCDSDDYLVPGAYRYLLDQFWDKNVDVLRFLSITLDRYVLRKWTEPNDVTGEVLYEGYGRVVFQHPFFASLCTHIYRKSYLDDHHLRLPDMIMDEDRVFNLQLYLLNPRVRVCTSRVYRYTVEGSQTTIARDVDKVRRMLPDFLYEFSLCNQYMDKCGEDESALQDYLGQRRYFRTTAFFSRLLSARLPRKEWKFYILQLHELQWLPLPYEGKLSLLIHVISANYCLYYVASWLFSMLFVPLILPRIPRN